MDTVWLCQKVPKLCPLVLLIIVVLGCRRLCSIDEMILTETNHRGNRTSHCFYNSHYRIRLYKVLFTLTSECVRRDGKRSENTKAWKDAGLSDFAVVVYCQIPL